MLLLAQHGIHHLIRIIAGSRNFSRLHQKLKSMGQPSSEIEAVSFLVLVQTTLQGLESFLEVLDFEVFGLGIGEQKR